MFLPLGALIEAVTAVRDEDDSGEKKETSLMELLELVFACCGSAMMGFNMKLNLVIHIQ